MWQPRKWAYENVFIMKHMNIVAYKWIEPYVPIDDSYPLTLGDVLDADRLTSIEMVMCLTAHFYGDLYDQAYKYHAFAYATDDTEDNAKSDVGYFLERFDIDSMTQTLINLREYVSMMSKAYGDFVLRGLRWDRMSDPGTRDRQEYWADLIARDKDVTDQMASRGLLMVWRDVEPAVKGKRCSTFVGTYDRFGMKNAVLLDNAVKGQYVGVLEIA